MLTLGEDYSSPFFVLNATNTNRITFLIIDVIWLICEILRVPFFQVEHYTST